MGGYVQMIFHNSDEYLKKLGALHTTREIQQQPKVWKEIATSHQEKLQEWKGFLEEIFAKHNHVRIIFTGAGTSAYIGEVLVPVLNGKKQSGVRFEAIATTDIVSNPTAYLTKEEPTILVSFARSGNSPESVGTVEVAEKIVRNLYHVIITCNKDGKLAQRSINDPNSLLILLTDKVNDRSFAMTSSFSSMVLAAYQLFADDFSLSKLEYICEQGYNLLAIIDEVTDEVLEFDFDRIVYLGSGTLGKYSREAALKMLELTSGFVATLYETSLGFRHGPKTFLTEKTLVVFFISKDSYTKQYDLDMLKEIHESPSQIQTVVLSEQDEYAEYARWTVPVNTGAEDIENDFYLGLLYTLFAQTLALKKSLRLQLTPDNPVQDGSVNRVVKGVVIYPWNQE